MSTILMVIFLIFLVLTAVKPQSLVIKSQFHAKSWLWVRLIQV